MMSPKSWWRNQFLVTSTLSYIDKIQIIRTFKDIPPTHFTAKIWNQPLLNEYRGRLFWLVSRVNSVRNSILRSTGVESYQGSTDRKIGPSYPAWTSEKWFQTWRFRKFSEQIKKILGRTVSETLPMNR